MNDEMNDPYDIRWHGHRLDPYRVCELYEVTHPALAHAVKKILCAGQRGSKGQLQDVEEAIRALDRYVEMAEEDADVVLAEFHEATQPPGYRFRDPDGNSVTLSVGEQPDDPPRNLVRVEPQPGPDDGGLWWDAQLSQMPHPDATAERIAGIWYWVIPQDEETTPCSD